MLQVLITMFYPITAFLFVRLALRCFARWAAKPQPVWLVLGVVCSAVTFHAGWLLFGLTATTPYWWAKWLVASAFAWVIFKNLRDIWQFEALRKAAVQNPTV